MRRTVTEEGPTQGQVGARPTPFVTGISSTLEAERGKLTSEIDKKLGDVIRRKADALRPLVLALVFAAVTLSAAVAQGYSHSGQLGTTPTQILAQNPSRKILRLQNNSSVLIAFCPERNSGQPPVCAINGAGSITLPPGAHFPASQGDGLLVMPNAWSGVAAAQNSPYAILEQP